MSLCIWTMSTLLYFDCTMSLSFWLDGTLDLYYDVMCDFYVFYILGLNFVVMTTRYVTFFLYYNNDCEWSLLLLFHRYYILFDNAKGGKMCVGSLLMFEILQIALMQGEYRHTHVFTRTQFPYFVKETLHLLQIWFNIEVVIIKKGRLKMRMILTCFQHLKARS